MRTCNGVVARPAAAAPALALALGSAAVAIATTATASASRGRSGVCTPARATALHCRRTCLLAAAAVAVRVVAA